MTFLPTPLRSAEPAAVNWGEARLPSQADARYYYYFDRDSLQESVRLGSTLVARTSSGNILRFELHAVRLAAKLAVVRAAEPARWSIVVADPEIDLARRALPDPRIGGESRLDSITAWIRQVEPVVEVEPQGLEGYEEGQQSRPFAGVEMGVLPPGPSVEARKESPGYPRSA